MPFGPKKNAPKILNSLMLPKANKKTLVSANAGKEKNLYLGVRKFISLINFPEIFSFLF